MTRPKDAPRKVAEDMPRLRRWRPDFIPVPWPLYVEFMRVAREAAD